MCPSGLGNSPKHRSNTTLIATSREHSLVDLLFINSITTGCQGGSAAYACLKNIGLSLSTCADAPMNSVFHV